MDDAETWRWIWLGTALIFGVGELAIAGSFFLAPFAIGAALAAILAFLDVSLVIQWLVFVGVSLGTFISLRPIARRLDQGEPTDGIGSKRLINETGTVLEEIPDGFHELGMVRVHREEWRAQSVDGRGVAAGELVQVVEQRGTRLVVTRASVEPGAYPAAPPASPPVIDPYKEP
jgi:membrane protein implicated in regulation of membrane protease activity